MSANPSTKSAEPISKISPDLIETLARKTCAALNLDIDQTKPEGRARLSAYKMIIETALSELRPGDDLGPFYLAIK
jgi:hypothetical protein